MAEKRLALVTGGNRGLGFETCRQLAKLDYQVILTSRQDSEGQKKAEELKSEGLDVGFLKLDIANPESIQNLYQTIKDQWGHLEVLVNNAAILLDKDIKKNQGSNFDEHYHRLQDTLQTNVVGAYALCDCLGTLMQKQQYGRIVNMSSSLGQLMNMSGEYETYSISKAAVNAVTRVFAAKYKSYRILVNSVDPGWVKTDMGGPTAPRSIDEGVRGIIWAATLSDNGPTGGFFRDGQPLDW